MLKGATMKTNLSSAQRAKVLVIRSLLATSSFDGVELAAQALSAETGKGVEECRTTCRLFVLKSLMSDRKGV